MQLANDLEECEQHLSAERDARRAAERHATAAQGVATDQARALEAAGDEIEQLKSRLASTERYARTPDTREVLASEECSFGSRHMPEAPD